MAVVVAAAAASASQGLGAGAAAAAATQRKGWKGSSCSGRSGVSVAGVRGGSNGAVGSRVRRSSVRCEAQAIEREVLRERGREQDAFSGLQQVCAVLGTQWGDEGKGKLVDILAQRFDVVARCQVW